MTLGKVNGFIRGCDKFKKDMLTKQVAIGDHKAALEAQRGRRDLEHAVAIANQSQQQAILNALTSLFHDQKMFSQ